MNNNADIKNECSEVVKKLKDGKLDYRVAAQINRAVTNYIKAVRSEIEYTKCPVIIAHFETGDPVRRKT